MLLYSKVQQRVFFESRVQCFIAGQFHQTFLHSTSEIPGHVTGVGAEYVSHKAASDPCSEVQFKKLFKREKNRNITSLF